MRIKIKLIISFLVLFSAVNSQTVSRVYKMADLLTRIDTSKTILVINFWATWCKPCIQELPAFDSLSASSKNYKVILVCLDFKEEIDKKVNPFLQKNKIASECVLFDEINGNDYINKISKEWSGAIPATLIVNKGRKLLIEKKMNLKELRNKLLSIEN